MKKLTLLPFLLITFCLNAQSPNNQTNNKQPSIWDNVRFGGGLGLGFGNRSATINISPSAIYDFQNGFAVGAGVGYQYSKINSSRSNIFSTSALTFYNPIQQLQISAEFEQLFVNQRDGIFKRNFDYPALYLGLGYNISRWSAIGIRYDVLYRENRSIYSSAFAPFVRVYF